MSLTGPYSKLDVSTGSTANIRLAYHYKQWYRTKPLRSQPTPFVSQHAVSFTTNEKPTKPYYIPLDAPNYPWSYDIWTPTGSSNPQVLQTRAAALNKAYSKYLQEVYSRVELGLNIAERRQAMNMIAQRANSLRRAYEALKKGNLDAFKKALGITSGSGGRWSRPDQASRLWLEYHFGWEQLLKDLHDAATYLDQPWPRNLKASGKGTGQSVIKTDDTRPSGGFRTKYNLRWHVRMGGTVSVTDPSLYTLTSLGLVNPASIAWELVPFSFVVDWFYPIGNYLASYTDFIGLSVSNPYTTEYRVASNGETCRYDSTGAQTGTPIYGESWVMSRSLGITGPTIRLKQYRGISPVRAATAIALLIRSFRSRLPI